MVGERAIIVIDGMTVDSAVGMSVRNNVAVIAARVMECKVEVVVAGVSRRGFRRGNTDTLERKGERRRHHDDDGKPSEKRSPREVQRSGPSMISVVDYIVAGIGRTSAHPELCRKGSLQNNCTML